MKDFGSDLIFYIIAAIIAIVSSIGRKKRNMKVPQPVRKEDQVEEETVVMNELEWGMAGDSDDEVLNEQPEQMVVESEKTDSPEPMAEQFSDEGEMEILNLFEGEGESMTESELGNVENDVSYYDDEESGLGSEIADEFDLEKAVIFSEILNRKEDF